MTRASRCLYNYHMYSTIHYRLRFFLINALLIILALFCLYPVLAMAQSDSLKSSQPQGIVCPKCGTLNPSNAKFCLQCGASLISRPGSYDDPNRSRFIILPTGELIPKGTQYFANYELFFVQYGYAPLNRLQIGVGMTIFPFGGFENQLFTGGFKIALYRSNTYGFNLATGANIILWKEWLFDEDSDPYTLNTFYISGDIHTEKIVFGAVLNGTMVGGTKNGERALWGGLGFSGKLSNRVQFISEILGADFFNEIDNSVVTYGFRVHGERISGELAFLRPMQTTGKMFLGAPLLNITIYF